MVTADHQFDQHCNKGNMEYIKQFNDYEILVTEILSLKKQISSFNKETPFYTYGLFYPNGIPFYIGKGKKNRCISHLKTIQKNFPDAHDKLDGEPPIVFIIEGNISENRALSLEKEMISKFGRLRLGEGNLLNILSGGSFSQSELSSYGGTIGGRITKDNKIGIFSDDYDRSKQTRINHELGVYSNVDHAAAGRIGGKKTKENKTGIFSDEWQPHRTDTARKAALVNIEKNGLTGIVSPEWRAKNEERARLCASNGGKKGGKTTGSMFWWNDGIKNCKSYLWPGEGWVRGQLLSEKRLKNLFGRGKKQ